MRQLSYSSNRRFGQDEGQCVPDPNTGCEECVDSMSKARITYRFDPKERAESERRATRVQQAEETVIPLYQEEFQVIETKREEEPGGVTPYQQAEREQVESLFESHALNTFTTDFGSWNSPFETEGERVERIIRDSQQAREGGDKDAARSPLLPLSQHDHPQPPFSPQHDYPRQPHPTRMDHPERTSPYEPMEHDWRAREPYPEPGPGIRYTKSSGTPWFRIATSVAGAVVTGIAFGFFVLSMFSSDREVPGGVTITNTVASPAPSVQAGTKPTGDAAAATATSALPSTAVQIPAKSYTFLQNGVFSSLQGAKAMQDTMSKKGLATALDTSDKMTVFVGFGKTRDDANVLKQQVQAADKSIEVYLKNVDFPAMTSIRWSGAKPESVPSFIAEGDKLVNTISGLTVVHLAETKPTAIGDDSMKTIRTSHQTLITMSAALTDGDEPNAKSSVQKMTTAMNSAVQSLEEYKKAPSQAMLWQAQSSLMQYILAEKALLSLIGT